MDIELRQVVPKPIADVLPPGSIWTGTQRLTKGKKYMINAPSGRGKSTLVSYLDGIRQDYTGQLLFDGKDSRHFSLDEWSRLRKSSISVVFQDLRLFGQLTAWENLELKSRLSPLYTKNEIIYMAEQLGVNTQLHKPCRLLSYGQQQRMAIIRSLIQPFHWLLLDEPFSHLDKENIETAWELISGECDKRGAGLLLTSLGGQDWLSFDEELTV